MKIVRREKSLTLVQVEPDDMGDCGLCSGLHFTVVENKHQFAFTLPRETVRKIVAIYCEQVQEENHGGD